MRLAPASAAVSMKLRREIGAALLEDRAPTVAPSLCSAMLSFMGPTEGRLCRIDVLVEAGPFLAFFALSRSRVHGCPPPSNNFQPSRGVTFRVTCLNCLDKRLQNSWLSRLFESLSRHRFTKKLSAAIERRYARRSNPRHKTRRVRQLGHQAKLNAGAWRRRPGEASGEARSPTVIDPLSPVTSDCCRAPKLWISASKLEGLASRSQICKLARRHDLA